MKTLNTFTQLSVAINELNKNWKQIIENSNIILQNKCKQLNIEEKNLNDVEKLKLVANELGLSNEDFLMMTPAEFINFLEIKIKRSKKEKNKEILTKFIISGIFLIIGFILNYFFRC